MSHPSSTCQLKKLGSNRGRQLRIGLLNCFSLRNKVLDVLELAVDKDLDLFALTETWLRKEDSALCSEIKELNFNLVHSPRGSRGGGVGLLAKSNIKMSKIQRKFTTFECQEVLLKAPLNIRLVIVYRPGTLGQFERFLDEFEDLLVSLAEHREPGIIMGDFNVHMERCSDPKTSRFIDLLCDFGWHNAVEGPTHNKDGTLDLILTKKEEGAIKLTEISTSTHPAAPDHYLISCLADVHVPTPDQYVIKSGRNINGIEMDVLKEEILCSELCDHLPEQLDDCVELYNKTLGEVLDEVAPIVERRVKKKSVPKWLRNPKCRTARRTRRAKERRWRTCLRKSTDPKALRSAFVEWKTASKEASKVLDQARSDYYRAEFDLRKGNSKAQYRLVNDLMGKEKIPSTLPSDKDPNQLVSEFNHFFKTKVTKIYSEIEAQAPSPPKSTPVAERTTAKFSVFSPVSDEDLLKTIKEMNKKHCQLDPMPTSLVSGCLPELLPSISKIVNDSLANGTFPHSFKEAIIRPSFKGKELDPDHLTSYRPVSNLSFLSKVIEKVVSVQLIDYLEKNKLLPSHQSAYRRFHSCETATLRIANDLLMILDTKSKAILILLDLSAAFDTVKHAKLLEKLQSQYGISGKVLEWFQSYLSGRSTSVLLQGERSEMLDIDIGVPQGSILGPILFVLYTKDLQDIAKLYGLEIHLFADDTQLFIRFDRRSLAGVTQQIQDCLSHIKWWMSVNYLKLNPDKTEVLILNNRADKTPNLHTFQLDPSNEPFGVSSVVRNLGIWFDSQMSMSEHISRTIRGCWAQLSNLWRIGSRLNRKMKIQLVHSLIHSRLDYGNALLKGASKKDLNRLQKVQNSAVRFINNHKRRRGVTAMRQALHFLPVPYRIDFKILLLTYKCINGVAPPYLQELIQPRVAGGKKLRKDGDKTLLSRNFSTKYRSTEAAFSVCAPRLWNTLPRDLREASSVESFKIGLKTHLFRLAYELC